MTYRERRLAKAERLRQWAANREAKATAQLNSNPELRHDHAFNTQPGHIPERARMNARDDRATESLAKAASMESRAAGIEHQLDRSIYSDDEDAPERLRARIAELEAARDHKKQVNAMIRAMRRKMPGRDEAAILAALVENGSLTREAAMRLANNFARFPYHGLGFPAYELTNLGANIRRQKQRLEQIEHEKIDGPPWRYFNPCRHEGVCLVCNQKIEKGSAIVYRRGMEDQVKHFTCYEGERAAQTAAQA